MARARSVRASSPARTRIQFVQQYTPVLTGPSGERYVAQAYMDRQPDGGLITVIGDVTGHGLHAAVMMSQLRTALRAYAVEGKSPGQLLTRVEMTVGNRDDDRLDR